LISAKQLPTTRIDRILLLVDKLSELSGVVSKDAEDWYKKINEHYMKILPLLSNKVGGSMYVSLDASTPAPYYQKYLKYKQKYLELKNKRNARNNRKY
jgi:hypothetical protein